MATAPEIEALQRRCDELEDRFNQFAEIGIRLSTEKDLDRLLELILTEARRLTRADAGSLYVAEKGHLHFRVNQNETLLARHGPESAKAFKSFSFPIDERSLAGSVAKNLETLNIPDVQAHPLHNKKVDEELDYVTRTMLVVAMVDHQGHVIGVLQLINSLDEDGRAVPFRRENQQMAESLASLAGVALENARLYKDVERAMDSLVKYSAKAIDARDPSTAGHSSRVSRYSVDIARALDTYSVDELREIRIAGLLHDIGKIGVREQVLTKANKLNDDQIQTIRERFALILSARELDLERARAAGGTTPEAVEQAKAALREELESDLAFVEEKNVPGFLTDEDLARLEDIASKTFTGPAGEERPYLTPFEMENLTIRKGNLTGPERLDIESHVVQSAKILKQIPFPRDLKNVVRYAGEHHEKIDGTGYPKGLRGEEIATQSRILAVADIFDALTAADRPYKKAMSNEKAMAILRDGVERGWWDGDIVETLSGLIDQGAIRKRSPED